MNIAMVIAMIIAMVMGMDMGIYTGMDTDMGMDMEMKKNMDMGMDTDMEMKKMEAPRDKNMVFFQSPKSLLIACISHGSIKLWSWTNDYEQMI